MTTSVYVQAIAGEHNAHISSQKMVSAPQMQSNVEYPVLIVDDDRAIRDLVSESLEFEGIPFIVASNGAEALEIVCRYPTTSLILLDMRMPVMDGWAFAHAYRRIVPDPAPIVTITAAQDAAAWAREIQAADYLPKPFDINDLMSVIERTRRSSTA